MVAFRRLLINRGADRYTMPVYVEQGILTAACETWRTNCGTLCRSGRGSYGRCVTAVLTKAISASALEATRPHFCEQLHLRAQTMSVLLETSLGDITIDLLVDDAPRCCEK